jgi:hypothetical protein
MPGAIHPDHPNLVFVGGGDSVPPPLAKGMSDYPSILLVHADVDDLSADELSTLDEFGKTLTENYDAGMGGPRTLANFAELERTDDGRWRAGKFTWQTGHQWFGRLEDAVGFLADRFEIAPKALAPRP